MSKNLWFKRKKYGYGWTPVTRQGWAVIIAWIILFYLLITQTSDVWFVKLTTAIFMIGILIYISYKKGEKPRWQWGEKDKGN